MSDMMRVTGMVTGLDTDDMVKKLLNLEQTKIDRVKQDKQYTEWKQDAYRDIINTLREFKDGYFDYLNSDNNMRSPSTLNSFMVTYGGEDTSDYLNITATRESTFQNYPITDIITAKRAEVTGTVLADQIQGNTISNFDINYANDNNRFRVTLNGVNKEIVIDNNPADISALRDNLESKIDEAFGINADGSKKIAVEVDVDNSIKFVTDKTNNMSIDHSYNFGFDLLLASDLSGGVTLDEQNNKFKLSLSDGTTTSENTLELTTGTYANIDEIVSEAQTQVDSMFGADTIRVLNQNNRLTFKAILSQGSAVGDLAATTIGDTVDITEGNNDVLQVTIDGEEKTLTLDAGSYSKDQLLSHIQSKLNEEFGANKALVTLDGSDLLRFEAIDSTKTLSASKQENGGLAALGMADQDINKNNKIDLKANLADIAGHFTSDLIGADTDGDGYDIEFTINDEHFEFDSAITSLKDIMEEVNSNQSANVLMKYDELNDNITVETKETGVTTKLIINDTVGEGNLMDVLGINNTDKSASDAVVTFDDGTAEGLSIVRSTNSFSVDGLMFELKKDISNTNMDISIEKDPTDAYETIKGFVEKYNEVVTKLNEGLTEKRYYDYKPLTDAQKEDMSEDEIELWEENAKSGILKSDSTVQNILYNLRSTIFKGVEGVGISLPEIGITTSDNYMDGGKLLIDEDKLKSALRDKPEAVTNLFTKHGDTEATKGLSHRLYDIIQDNIRTTRDTSGRKGLLLEKAGVEGDVSEFTNYLTNKMDDYDDRIESLIDVMSRKEDEYYNMFARMEAAISRMNNQSSWITSQMGSGSGM